MGFTTIEVAALLVELGFTPTVAEVMGFTTIEVTALLVELGFTPAVAEVMGFTTIEVAALLVELDFTLAEVTPTSDVTAAVMALHSLSPQFAAPLKHCPAGGVGHSSHLPRAAEEEAKHCWISAS
jgi:hypothetical protein